VPVRQQKQPLTTEDTEINEKERLAEKRKDKTRAIAMATNNAAASREMGIAP
jgi:hypothetical protein